MRLADDVAGAKTARCPCVEWETGGGECGGTARRVNPRTRRSHYERAHVELAESLAQYHDVSAPRATNSLIIETALRPGPPGR